MENNMPKNKMFISEYEFSGKVHEIILENVRFDKNGFAIIEKIIKHFANNEELFLGFYRTDGININRKQIKEYKNIIQNFFDFNGEIVNLNNYLLVAKTKLNDSFYEVLPYVIDYYLDIVFFNPKINWETFVNYHFQYMEHGHAGYIINDFTEFLFSYFDSGDFSVSFNSEKYFPEDVDEKIREIMNNF